MPNSYDLHGKSVIVTGGAKSSGRAITELLVASGATVRIWDANTAEVMGASSNIVDITRGYVRTRVASTQAPYSTCPAVEPGIERIGARNLSMASPNKTMEPTPCAA